MAEGCLAQAGEILAEAHDLHQRKVWNLVVRRSQEVVELALKGALRSAGVEVPKIHDVGVILKDHGDRFPGEFRGHSDRLASISRRLRQEREVAFYGDEEAGAPPQHLYTEEDARTALDEAGYVLDVCRSLLQSLR
jgi:HEPN domain-containing protein